MDEEYYQRYENICDEIGRATCCVGVLKCLNEIDVNRVNTQDARYSVIDLFCELTKRELVLAVWKLYYDTNSKANSIKNLNNYLHRIGAGKKVKMNLSDDAKIYKQSICDMRNEYLAHVDYCAGKHKLEMSVVIGIFYEIIDLVKELYNPDVDERVKPISEKSIKWSEYNAYRGMYSIMKDLMK